MLALNAVLALAVQVAAPAQPVRSDRQKYESAARHGLQPNCEWSIYCYRLLVPVVLDLIPISSERRWRGYRWAADTTAGSVLAVTTAGLVAGPASGLAAAVIVSIVVQTSFGFSFTA